MSETAENVESTVDDENLEDLPVDEDIDDDESEDTEGQDEESEEEPESVEIVREGTQPEFSQEQVDSIVSRRVKRLNTTVEEGKDSQDAANVALEQVQEQNKLLKLALEQQKEAKPLSAPDPNDFDDGIDDPGFIKKKGEHDQHLISEEVKKQVAAATEVSTAGVGESGKARDLRQKQFKHYERAAKIGAKDYEATEDAALEILGRENANHVIDNFGDSQFILYYLGKNKAEADSITSLLKTNPIQGVAELGRLSAQLKVKPGKGKKAAPDPDEDIQGDVVGGKKGDLGPPGATYS